MVINNNLLHMVYNIQEEITLFFKKKKEKEMLKHPLPYTTS